jgi:hypothetical protein
MASYTLDDIRAAADTKYAATEFPFGDDTLVLRNALRLSKEERKELNKIQDSIKEDPEDGMVKALMLVTADKAVAQKFIDEVVAGDTALLATVFDLYIGGPEAGEA